MDGFFDTAAVEAQTGRPIRSAWRRPGDPRPFPAPDAVVVAPATFNTVNKWAAGPADTLAVATLCEACGLDVPVAVLPCVADALASHPAYRGEPDPAARDGRALRRPVRRCGGGGRRSPGVRLGAGPRPARTALTRPGFEPARRRTLAPGTDDPEDRSSNDAVREARLDGPGRVADLPGLHDLRRSRPRTHEWTLDEEALRVR